MQNVLFDEVKIIIETASHGFNDPEKAQFVLWKVEEHGWTAIQRKFRTKYRKSAPSLSTIRRWCEKYQEKEGHSHTGGNGRPQISVKKKDTIRTLFNENPTISLRNSAAQIGLHRTTIWNYFRRDLKLYPYNLQLYKKTSDRNKLNGVHFAQYCQNELRNDSEFLRGIVFFDKCSFSLSGFVNHKNCRL